MTPVGVLFALSAFVAIALIVGTVLAARREAREQRAAERIQNSEYLRNPWREMPRTSMKQPAAKGFRH